MGSVGVGTRLFITGKLSSIRPYAEAMLGYYWLDEYSDLDEEKHDVVILFAPNSGGAGTSLGLGLQYFVVREFMIELGLRRTAIDLVPDNEDRGRDPLDTRFFQMLTGMTMVF